MHISHVNIFDRGLEDAIPFCRDVLGLELQFSSAEHGYASFLAGGIGLGLAVPGDEQRDLVGQHPGIGLEVADFGAEHARLSAAGVVFPMPPARQPWDGFMALLADPDGNVLYLDQVSAADHSAG